MNGASLISNKLHADGAVELALQTLGSRESSAGPPPRVSPGGGGNSKAKPTGRLARGMALAAITRKPLRETTRVRLDDATYWSTKKATTPSQHATTSTRPAHRAQQS